jgi:hypothetical protein
MAKAEKIAEAVRNFLHGFNEPYRYDATTGQFEFDVELTCRLAGTRVFLHALDDGLTLYAAVNVLADPDNRLNAAEYIVRANYGLLSGGFEMDMENGSINYRTFIHCGGAAPADLDLKVGIVMATTALNRFGNGLIDVINNEKTPEEAVNEAKNVKRRD